MSRETWNIVKQSKNFNVRIFRSGLLLIIISLILSGMVASLAFYRYLHLTERDYYATNGMEPPVMLSPMATANVSPNALLPPDPIVDDTRRMIPQ
jgi:intracellular multiplication protein IcmM